MKTGGMKMSWRGAAWKTSAVALAVVPLWAAIDAKAGNEVPSGTAYDQMRGEISPGTGAPTREQMVNAIKGASPTSLYALLEYGERVECFECIPLLEDKLLASDDAQVREISAWWLRRRSFGFGPVMAHMQRVIATDKSAVQRARAAEALGEFLDPHGAASLADAAMQDSDATVRLAAVRGLTRLNSVSGREALAAAMTDDDEKVRAAALAAVLKVNFFREPTAIVARLDDDAAGIRRSAAQLSGEMRITAASARLAKLLSDDGDASVRQASAIALGRIGGVEAVEALSSAQIREKDDGVLDAVDIALRMR